MRKTATIRMRTRKTNIKANIHNDRLTERLAGGPETRFPVRFCAAFAYGYAYGGKRFWLTRREAAASANYHREFHREGAHL